MQPTVQRGGAADQQTRNIWVGQLDVQLPASPLDVVPDDVQIGAGDKVERRHRATRVDDAAAGTQHPVAGEEAVVDRDGPGDVDRAPVQAQVAATLDRDATGADVQLPRHDARR